MYSFRFVNTEENVKAVYFPLSCNWQLQEGQTVQEEEKEEKKKAELKTIVEAIMSSNNPLNHYHTCFPSILINKYNAKD